MRFIIVELLTCLDERMLSAMVPPCSNVNEGVSTQTSSTRSCIYDFASCGFTACFHIRVIAVDTKV